MIVDGKVIAEEIAGALEGERARFARAPRLGIVMSTGDKATESFVRIKTKMAERLKVELVREELSKGATTADAIAAVENLQQTCDGVIVQLPLQAGIDADAVCAALSSARDVDGIGRDPRVLPPVVAALQEILARRGVDLAGMRALVVGEGRLVGAPAASWLSAQGAHVATISESDDLAQEALRADLIVLGAGAGNILHPEMVRDGVIIFDAGTSESDGKLQGDADPACSSKAKLFTPVPGGVGPIAVALIFRNLFSLMTEKEPAA